MTRIPLILAALLLTPVACKRDDMADQPRMRPNLPTSFFADGSSARPFVPNTVPRGGPPLPAADPAWPWPASATTQPSASDFPFPLTRADLLRGQEQFTIYCSPCHGDLGDGHGMIPQRGFTPPPSYHIDRLRNASPGYFYTVMTNGIGAMFSYSERVAPDDRWRIAAYIRALQLSQHAPLSDLPPDERQKLPGGAP